jgi:4-hydroxy-4-methyl-2-oxoglutarate aldolase
MARSRVVSSPIAANSPVSSRVVNGMERFAGFDPATLYEAAGQKGMIDPAIRPAWSGARVCGPAVTVECPPGDNLMLHVAVADASPGIVIVAKVCGYMLAGAWGEILTAAAQARGVAGLAIDGAVRDIDAIREAGFPVFSRGQAIGSCTKERSGKVGTPIQFGGVTVRQGDLILGDADGLVVIEQDRLDEVYDTALERRAREAEIIRELRAGRTTMELLGLTDPRIRTHPRPK